MPSTSRPTRAPLVVRAIRALVLVAVVLAMALAGLSVLALAGADSGPVAFTLAVGLAVAPVPLYVALALRLDRFEPEPLRNVLFAFAWGATVAAFVALILNSVGTAIVGEELGTDAAEIYGGSISAPVVEEAAKGAALLGLFLWRRSEVDGVLDGIVYAAMVGLGFAMTENVFYYAEGAVAAGVPGAVGTFVLRGILSPFAHPVFTAATGIGFGLAALSRARTARIAWPLFGLAVAMGLHSLWNTAAAAGAFFGVYLAIMVPIFLALLGVVAIERRREVRLVRRHLTPYVGEAQARELGSLRARRRAVAAARRQGGRGAARAVRDFHETATELAFAARRAERGVPGGREDAAACAAALRAQMAQVARPRFSR